MRRVSLRSAPRLCACLLLLDDAHAHLDEHLALEVAVELPVYLPAHQGEHLGLVHHATPKTRAGAASSYASFCVSKKCLRHFFEKGFASLCAPIAYRLGDIVGFQLPHRVTVRQLLRLPAPAALDGL